VSETFTVPPGCTGLRIEGSSARYPADSTGHVTVDNPRHAAKVATNGAAYFHKRIEGFTHLPGNRCPNDDCRFQAHAFSTVCPRCGASLKAAGDGADDTEEEG
jgi:hypothetical protein